MEYIILFWLFGAVNALVLIYYIEGRKITLLQLIEAIVLSWLIVLFYVIMELVIIITWIVDKLGNITIIGK